MHKTGLQLLSEYLRSRRRDLVVALAVLVIFVAVLFLYSVPLEPAVYGGMLSGVVVLAYGAWDLLRFTQRRRALIQLRDEITLSLEHLPTPGDLLEEGYQELVALLFQGKAAVQAEAKEAQRELEEYYTLWAHQVKTPIAAARLLLQTGAGGEQAAELELELFKIERYVEMVLQYLRVESPSADLVIRRCSLDEIVRQAVRRYARLFIQKQIKLELDSLHEEVLTDPKWLGFVIEQVLSNALKYTHQGQISIYMDSTSPKTLVISDTGIGIAPEDLPRIFEKGYTGFTGRQEKHSTGIGLYLCKRILTRLSHPVAIESELGKGTKVKIRLDAEERLFE